jgi:hypothetical protein
LLLLSPSIRSGGEAHISWGAGPLGGPLALGGTALHFRQNLPGCMKPALTDNILASFSLYLSTAGADRFREVTESIQSWHCTLNLEDPTVSMLTDRIIEAIDFAQRRTQMRENSWSETIFPVLR